MSMSEAAKKAQREYMREYMREWRSKNKERVSMHNAKYRANNPEKCKAAKERYWERIAQGTGQ